MPLSQDHLKKNATEVIKLLDFYGPANPSNGITSIALLDDGAAVLTETNSLSSRRLTDSKVTTNQPASDVTTIIRKEIIVPLMPHLKTVNNQLARSTQVGGFSRIQLVFDRWALTLVPVFSTPHRIDFVVAAATENTSFNPTIVAESIHHLLVDMNNKFGQ